MKNEALLKIKDLEIALGETIGIFGPTGSGKTTLLNQIASESKQNYKISYCFQDNRLIKNISVRKNISLSLEKTLADNEVVQKSDYWLKVFDLTELADKYAGKISGGEAQRTNLARAFAWNGDIFLLDEPFSNQDEEHIKHIKKHIFSLKENNKTIILVSHCKEDLQELCEKIVELP